MKRKVRRSIDDVTPDEWDRAARDWVHGKKKKRTKKIWSKIELVDSRPKCPEWLDIIWDGKMVQINSKGDIREKKKETRKKKQKRV